jgi:hypothetical protein
MYVGLHHLVQILLQSNLVCVCVCVLPRPKAGSKTNFEVAHSSSLQNFGTQNFIACSLFSVSRLPRLRCC